MEIESLEYSLPRHWNLVLLALPVSPLCQSEILVKETS